jgi:CRISPR/Cas system CMR-associated protein Cmr3 (group 5 of RAMP superfamily)
MKKYILLILLTVFIFISFSQNTNSQNLSLDETVKYINNILPIIGETTNTFGGRILDSKIECDMFGNITMSGKIVYNDNSEQKFQSTISLKDVNIIWVGETHYSNGNFAGYQLRFEKSKNTIPIHTLEINNKEMGDRVAKAFMYLRKISKPDPFK